MPYNFDEEYAYSGLPAPPQYSTYQQRPQPFYPQHQQHAPSLYHQPPHQFAPHQHDSNVNPYQPYQPYPQQQPQSPYQPSPQAAPNFQVIVPSTQPQVSYETRAPVRQYVQPLPQHSTTQPRPRHPPAQYPTPQQQPQYHPSLHQQRSSQYQQHGQPPNQSGYHYNQQMVPHQQPRPQHFQQRPTNGNMTMTPQESSARPQSRPQQPPQNGHVPSPPVRAQDAPTQSATPPASEADYPVLLLSLADEYLMAAAKIDSRSDMYFKLVATSLGCLESVLTNFKLPPLREAQLSLRYAQILYEETENYDDAERVLTKAIDICERNKFLDLKYTLQLLLACVLYQSRPKAAIKDLQSMLEEIEAYKHTVWGYTARYQLAMFCLSAATVRDLHNAINHMEKLSISANANGDRCIAAFADVVCALLHLETSGSEAVSSSQQYLAKARALSTNDEVSSIHQIMFMMEFADLCCSIREYDHAQCDVKRRRMQEVWTAIIDKEGWMRDGDMMLLPVKKSSLRGIQLQLGGLVREKNGTCLLPFSWMETDVAEAWGFLLCAITKAHTNAADGKAEQFIEHGLQRTRDTTTSASGRMTGVATAQQKILECRFLVELAFLQCQKGEWDKAEKAVNTISKVAEEVINGFPQSMVCISQYLRGTIHQGSGDLDAAVAVYQAPMFDLGQFIRGPESSAPHHKSHDSETETIRNIAILAAMNRLLIINHPSHPQYQRSSSIVEQLNTLVKASQDKNIQTSYTLIHSLTTQTGILRSKQSLISALNSAKAISNGQIMALVLMTMHQKHFLGVTDEHAVKCIRATSMQMRNWGNPMWMHVTAGVEAEALEFAGKGTEAAAKMGEAQRRAEGLPERIGERVGM